MRLRCSATTVVFVCAALAGGCAASDANGDKLAELEAEPIASFVPPGADLVSDSRAEEEVSLGKLNPARISRVFSIQGVDQNDANAALASVMSEATNSGWRMGPAPADRAYPSYGTKTLQGGPATIVVGHFWDDDKFMITVELRHTRCPAPRC